MKTDMHRVDYDGTPNPNGNWWVWNETCDRCGRIIFDTSTQCSCPHDENEADFCNECLMYLIDNGIDYDIAKETYKGQ